MAECHAMCGNLFLSNSLIIIPFNLNLQQKHENVAIKCNSWSKDAKRPTTDPNQKHGKNPTKFQLQTQLSDKIFYLAKEQKEKQQKKIKKTNGRTAKWPQRSNPLDQVDSQMRR